MKKAISLLLVLTVALSLSVTSFAATDIPGTYGAENNNARMMLAMPRTIAGSATGNYTVGAGELFLVNSNKLVGAETELRPNENYKYDIHYTTSAFTDEAEATIIAGSVKLTKAMVGAGTVKLRTIKGSSAISSAKIKTVGSGSTQTYRLEIDTRANYGTKTTEVEYSLNVNNTDTANTFAESNHSFTVGFNTINDSDTEVGEGGTITISNDAPVILKDQFADIARSANYKNVIFESDDGNWVFTGKVAGMGDTNFSYNYDPDTDLLNKYPDQEFKFLSFPAGVNFPTTGEMRIDVSDISDDFSTMYAYLYRDGRLTQINGTYDTGADELVFRTNYLGKFIITNSPITETSIGPEVPPVEEPGVEEPTTTPGNYNPPTGAAPTNAFAALGLVILASAAAISGKRK